MTKIYVRIECGNVVKDISWVRYEDYETYLRDDRQGDGFIDYGETPCGTAFEPLDAKRFARRGISLAKFDGGIKPKATYWVLDGCKLKRVKIGPNGSVSEIS